MTNQINDIDGAIQSLKERIEREPKRAGGRIMRTSPELRADILALWQRSRSTPTGVANLLGLDPKSIRNWAKAAKSRLDQPDEKITVSANPQLDQKPRTNPGFKRLRVSKTVAVTDRPQVSASKAGHLSLSIASGAQITGLTIEDVKQLLQASSK